jgi:hypothetical protein
MIDDKLRGTGRTTRMIESIPNPEEYSETVKFYVVGMSSGQARHICKMAEQQRPELKGHLVPISATGEQGLGVLSGIWSDLIFVDHFVYESIEELPIETQAWLGMFNTIPDMTPFMKYDTVAQNIKNDGKPSLWKKTKDKLLEWLS